MNKTSALSIVHEFSSATTDELAVLIERYSSDPRKQVQRAIGVAQRRMQREANERLRVSRMYELQREIAGDGVVVGIDEVGRGAIAGPLTVCAVVLPDSPHIRDLNDSKQLSAIARENVAHDISEQALAIGTAHIPARTIDDLGMAECLRIAMRRALELTGVTADAVLVDGNPMHIHPREHAYIHGDAKIASIAAASIVAKVQRDSLMKEMAQTWPQYHLDSCKGYASKAHIEAIQHYGLCEQHRATFCRNFL